MQQKQAIWCLKRKYLNINLLFLNWCIKSISHLQSCLFLVLYKMALRMAAALRAPGKLCSFSYVLLVFLLFCLLDVVSITVYDRDTLLNNGSSVAQHKPDFEFLKCRWIVHRHLGRAIEETPPTPKKRKKSCRSRQTETPCFPTSFSNHFTGQCSSQVKSS